MRLFYILLSIALLFHTNCSVRTDPKAVQYVSLMTEKLTPNQFALDYSEALKGNKESAWRIGRHYVFDNKPSIALRWFRIAAIEGKLEAMDDFYSTINSIRAIDDLDILEAELWLDKACKKKFKPAINTREAYKKFGNAWDKKPNTNGT